MTKRNRNNAVLDAMDEDAKIASPLGDDARFYYERYQGAKEQLSAFQQIAIAVGSQPSLNPILEIIVQKTTELMKAERSTVFVLSETRDYLWSRIAQNSNEIRVQIGEGIAGYVAKTGKSLNIVDVYKCPWFDKKFDESSGFRTKSCLCQPIWNNQHQIIGVIQVLNKLNGNFTLDDEDLLSSISSQVAVTLSNHAMYLSLLSKKYELEEAHQQLIQSSQRLDILYKIEHEAVTAASLEDLLRSISTQCIAVFKTNVCGILIANENHRELYLSAKSTSSAEIEFYKQILGQKDTVSASVEQSGEPYIDYATEEHDINEPHLASLGITLRSVIILPLGSPDYRIGTILLANKQGYIPGASPAPFSDADIKLLTLIASHITPSIIAELDRAAREKEIRLRTIGQMLSSVVHDLKSPLTTISLSAELMTELDDKDTRKRVSDKILHQIDTIRRMTSEVLSFARGESTFVARRINSSAIFKGVETMMQPEAERKNIALEYHDLYKDMLFCDESKIQRAIINLVKNAMEVLDPGGEIQIICEKRDNNVVFSVTDNGPGIPESVRTRLFEAFVTSGKKGGTGLGLSIVKNIAEAHHGSIQWKLAEPHGTTFELSIPLTLENN